MWFQERNPIRRTSIGEITYAGFAMICGNRTLRKGISVIRIQKASKENEFLRVPQSFVKVLETFKLWNSDQYELAERFGGRPLNKCALKT